MYSLWNWESWRLTKTRVKNRNSFWVRFKHFVLPFTLFSTKVDLLRGISLLNLFHLIHTHKIHFACKQQFKCLSALHAALDLLTSGLRCELEWEEFAILGAFSWTLSLLRIRRHSPRSEKREVSTQRAHIPLCRAPREQQPELEHSWAPCLKTYGDDASRLCFDLSGGFGWFFATSKLKYPLRGVEALYRADS